jgi:hypothetical protein
LSHANRGIVVLQISTRQAVVVASALVGLAILSAAIVVASATGWSRTVAEKSPSAPATTPVPSHAADAALGVAPTETTSPPASPPVIASSAPRTPSRKHNTAKATTPPRVTTPTSADGRCIQLPATVADKAGVSAAPCDGSAGQRWTFTRAGAFYHAGADKCLTIGGNQGRDINFRIQLFPCNSGPPQIYVPQPDGTLYNASANRCFGIYPKSEGGPTLGILPCTGGANERWKLPS